MAYAAQILADSTNGEDRMTTFVVTYPRMVHCFSDDTEFLSQIDAECPEFRSFDAIVELGAKIAQYEPADDDSEHGAISFVLPAEKIERAYTGPMISLQKQGVDMLVTPNHRVFSYRRTTGNVYKAHTQEAGGFLGGFSGKRRIPKAGRLKEDRVGPYAVSPNVAALVAWFVADGHLVRQGAGGMTAQFHFRKQRKVEAVESILNALDLPYRIKNYGRDTVINFDAPSWAEDCYREDGQKRYPDIVWRMSIEAYDEFKKATLESDGNVERQTINTNSPEVADQVQVLALLHGDAMNVRSYDGGLFKQRYLDAPYVSTDPHHAEFEEVPYSGRIVCFNVPSSYLVVRRSGKAFVSGNSEHVRHRTQSFAVGSSRAIPTGRLLEQLREDPVLPVFWGQLQPGMQATEALSMTEAAKVEKVWLQARDRAIEHAEMLLDYKVHKQVLNRLLEPWMWVTVVCTATEWENFFALRSPSKESETFIAEKGVDPFFPAQPEIQKVARMMEDLYREATPRRLQRGEWHLPFWGDNGGDRDRDHQVEPSPVGTVLVNGDTEVEVPVSAAASVGRVARTSYLRHDGEYSLGDDLALAQRILAYSHWSPAEQVASATYPGVRYGNLVGFRPVRSLFPNEAVATRA